MAPINPPIGPLSDTYLISRLIRYLSDKQSYTKKDIHAQQGLFVKLICPKGLGYSNFHEGKLDALLSSLLAFPPSPSELGNFYL